MKQVDGTAERIMYISDNLREQDKREVMASHGKDAKEACLESWTYSQIAMCFEGDDGKPVGIWGVSDWGEELGQIIWMLGTDELTATPNHRKEVTRLSKAAVDGLLANGCNYLHNWCMAENKTSLRWLRHLGFTIEDPEEFGENGELFCHFYRRN